MGQDGGHETDLKKKKKLKEFNIRTLSNELNRNIVIKSVHLPTYRQFYHWQLMAAN